MHQLAEQGRIAAYYQQLTHHHPLDYDALISTTKHLHSLPDSHKKTAITYFRQEEPPSDSDPDDSDDDKNVLDDMLEKISLLECEGGQERSALKKRWWTPEEDDKLRRLVEEHGARNWKKIAGYFEERTDVQCLHRWQKVLNPKLVKGPWVCQVGLRPRKKTTSWLN